MNKNSLLLIFSVVFLTVALLALGAFGFWLLEKKVAFKSASSKRITPTATAGTAKSIPIASPTISRTFPSPTVVQVSAENQLKQAFAQKYSKPAADVSLEINKNDGTHAQGVVKFNGEVGGGWFLGYNNNGNWIIVADGNGTVPCAAIKPYNFPTSMVPECWDKNTNSLITR